MTTSQVSAIIFGATALMLAWITWFGLYRRFRVDLLNHRLAIVRDGFFDSYAASGGFVGEWRPTLAWLERLNAGTAVLTPSRFVFACVWRMTAPASYRVVTEASAAETANAYTAQATAIIQSHLIGGCWPLWLLFRLRPNALDARLLRLMLLVGDITAR